MLMITSMSVKTTMLWGVIHDDCIICSNDNDGIGEAVRDLEVGESLDCELTLTGNIK
jgi:hypothetical protein